MADELHDLNHDFEKVRADVQSPVDQGLNRRLAWLAEQAEGIAAQLDQA